MATVGSALCVPVQSTSRGIFCPNEDTSVAVSHSGSTTCQDGYEPFLETTTLHQIHILVFVIAITHVVLACCVILLTQRLVQSWGKLDLRWGTLEVQPRCVSRVARWLGGVWMVGGGRALLEV